MKRLRQAALGLAVAAGLFAATGSATAATAHHGSVTCHGGTVAAGHYRSLTIAGSCTLASSGTVTVRHDLVVKRGAFFNAVTAATLNVRGDVWVKRHAVALLGCSTDFGCAANSDNHIRGSLTAVGAWATVVHGTTTRGNVSFLGGGGSEDCSITPILGQIPYYSTYQDGAIGGNFTVRRLHTCWFGLIRVNVGGNALMVGGRFGDPDAMEIVTNVIDGNLGCFNNVPQAQVGDSTGAPTVVGGHMRGVCATL
jgi:hypothetical protein